jgi:hypothetical protein
MNHQTTNTRPQRPPITCTSLKYDPTIGQLIMKKYGKRPEQLAFEARQAVAADLRERMIKANRLGRGISKLPESELSQDPVAKRQREYRRKKALTLGA